MRTLCNILSLWLNADRALDTSISTTTYTATLTDLITHFSNYRDTIVTSVETSIAPFISSELITFDLAAEHIPQTNSALGPATRSSELPGTATVTYAQTMYADVVPYGNLTNKADESDSNSPNPFFLYRTAKVILVPAVTDQNGHLTCATTSTFYPSTFTPGAQSSLLFSGINSNAEMYFQRATASKGPTVVTDISLSTPFVNVVSMGPTPTASGSAMGEFVSAMRKRAQVALPSPTAALNDSESVFGYVSPFFISFLAQDPDYVAQYPQLASCFPGGPSIDPFFKTAALVQQPTLVSELTSSTSSVTYLSGCFDTDSDLCSTVAPPPPPSITPLAESQPTSNPPLPVSSPRPRPPPTPPSVTPITESQPPPNPPTPVSSSPPPPPPSSPPAPPEYNPNNLAPGQLSQLFETLSVTPSSTPPEPSSTLPPPPTSLQTSTSPAVIPSVTPSEEATSVTEPAPTTSIEVFSGKTNRQRGKLLWSVWIIWLGCLVIPVL